MTNRLDELAEVQQTQAMRQSLMQKAALKKTQEPKHFVGQFISAFGDPNNVLCQSQGRPTSCGHKIPVELHRLVVAGTEVQAAENREQLLLGSEGQTLEVALGTMLGGLQRQFGLDCEQYVREVRVRSRYIAGPSLIHYAAASGGCECEANRADRDVHDATGMPVGGHQHRVATLCSAGPSAEGSSAVHRRNWTCAWRSRPGHCQEMGQCYE